jgi:DNA-binding NtrC family response regulator
MNINDPSISSEDMAFFRQVERAAFANPFSEERARADLTISGAAAGIGADDRIARMIATVRERVARLESRDLADIGACDASQRGSLGVALLFDAFHRYLDAFDRHIVDQEQAGDRPLAVPFAVEALALLRGRGFTTAAARHFFGIFYQLRRAYYFIARALPGRSPAMADVRRRLWSNVFTADLHRYERYLWNRMEDFSTLLLGETGTGKGAAASAIGRSGFIPFDEDTGRFAESFTRAFVAINLSQFPAALIESELFGHRKGAFTGAVEHHEGLLARCRPSGAVFLDEIGEVAPPLQVKLLQVLQERVFSPVGSHERLRFSGRVIAATNRPLEALKATGQFREDFYYRLCTDVIVMPSLRERLAQAPEELADLVAAMLPRLIGPAGKDLLGDVLAKLRRSPGIDYAWPGNVRELEQAVRRILLSGAYDPPARAAVSGAFARAEAGELTAAELLATYCRHLHQQLGTYEAVARKTGLDRRTVRKYIMVDGSAAPPESSAG